MQKHQKFSQPWKEFAENWQKLTSPGRPTKGEIRIYENFAKPVFKKKEVKILILGATPEIRDMLAKYKNAEVAVVDINMEMILVMTSLMKRKNSQEVWIKADWLDAPLRENYFDIIYGDCVLGNIPPQMHKKFLSKVSELLKRSGYFITRCETLRTYHRSLTPKEFCQFYSKAPLNFKTVNSFWELGLIALGRTKSGHLVVRKFWQKLQRYIKQNPNGHIKAILKLGGVFYPIDKLWYFYNEKGLRRLFRINFQIKDLKFDPKLNFIYKDYVPIYKLRSRND